VVDDARSGPAAGSEAARAPGAGRRNGPSQGSEAPEARRRLTEEERVARAFFRGDRLVSLPARAGKRAILLTIVRERCFPEDRDYEEKEVNMRLALLHPDVAALRRYLVDSGLMTRAGGIYRRGSEESDRRT
jgi:hypothetical protein